LTRKPGPKLPSKETWRKYRRWHPEWPPTLEADYTLDVKRIQDKKRRDK